MNPSSEDIRTLLEGSALFEFQVDMFIGQMNDTPDECICLFDTPGGQPSGWRVDRFPNLMVHVRGRKFEYKESYENAELVYNTLHRTTNTIIGSTRYIYIFALAEPFFMGYDEKQRPKWSVNFRINRTTT